MKEKNFYLSTIPLYHTYLFFQQSRNISTPYFISIRYMHSSICSRTSPVFIKEIIISLIVFSVHCILTYFITCINSSHSLLVIPLDSSVTSSLLISLFMTASPFLEILLPSSLYSLKAS